MIDAYTVLGVPASASQAELKAAHRRLVRRHHPDLVPPAERAAATRRVQEVNVAYGLVRDARSRAAYDRVRRRQALSPSAVDAQLAEQWEALARAAGRWAGRWWSRHRARLRAAGARAAARTRRAGLDAVGRLLWLVSCAAWGTAGLATAVAAQRLLTMDGWLAPVTGLVAGVLVGSQRGWQRRLRLAGIPPEPAAARLALALAAAAITAALFLDTAF